MRGMKGDERERDDGGGGAGRANPLASDEHVHLLLVLQVMGEVRGVCV